MRAFFADFMHLGRRPDLGLEGYTLPLGAEQDNPTLATLHAGEEIIATDEGELWAQGEAIPVERRGLRWWYAHKIATWHLLEEESLPAGTIRIAASAI